jgi:ABC-type sugar transport system substrate-binding protein
MSVPPAQSQPRPIRRARFRPLMIGAVVAGVALLAACSSGGGTSADPPGDAQTTAASAAATSACMAAADAYLKPYQQLETTLPASYTPLAAKPAAGGSIVHLIGPLPDEIPLSQAQQAAAQAIGWKFTALSFNGTVEDLDAKFEEAVAMKPTMITLSGFPLATIAQPVAAAKKAGIVVVLADVADEPTGYPGFAAVVEGGVVYNKVGELNAYEFMHDSDCRGNVAIFSLPYPILTVGTNAFTETVHQHCPACTVSVSELQDSDVGTAAATSEIVTKLQSDPATTYVYGVIGSVVSGLTAALRQSGLSGITVFGADPDTDAVAAIRDGTNKWWVQYGLQFNGWSMIDAGLRAMETHKPVPDSGDYPLGLLTKESTPAGTSLPVVPANYQQEFEALWHVSG